MARSNSCFPKLITFLLDQLAVRLSRFPAELEHDLGATLRQEERDQSEDDQNWINKPFWLNYATVRAKNQGD